MIPRFLEKKIFARLFNTPAIAILGPRQIGKTTLARQIANSWQGEHIYLDLQRPSNLAKISDPEMFLSEQSGKLVIIDEIQSLPHLFPVLRSVIDERRHNGENFGQFLLLGSASLDLIQKSAETLAGRISYIDLCGLNITEIDDRNDLNKLWLRGGFPTSFIAQSDESSLIWREDFITTYLERDIPSFDVNVPAKTLRRFWTMLAHLQGQIIDKSTLAGNLGVSAASVSRYLDLLVDLLLIRPVHPWSGNIGKRLVKRPKYYIRDSGILHALLSIDNLSNLLGHPVVGKSWEGFVIENLFTILPKRITPFFFETSSGAEIELILEISPLHRIAIDVKRSLSPVLSKGFYNACEALNVKERFVVYPGHDKFSYPNDVTIISLAKMMEIISNY